MVLHNKYMRKTGPFTFIYNVEKLIPLIADIDITDDELRSWRFANNEDAQTMAKFLDTKRSDVEHWYFWSGGPGLTYDWCILRHYKVVTEPK